MYPLINCIEELDYPSGAIHHLLCTLEVEKWMIPYLISFPEEVADYFDSDCCIEYFSGPYAFWKSIDGALAKPRIHADVIGVAWTIDYPLNTTVSISHGSGTHTTQQHQDSVVSLAPSPTDNEFDRIVTFLSHTWCEEDRQTRIGSSGVKGSWNIVQVYDVFLDITWSIRWYCYKRFRKKR